MIKVKISKESKEEAIRKLQEAGFIIGDKSKLPINKRYSGVVGSRTKPLVIKY